MSKKSFDMVGALVIGAFGVILGLNVNSAIMTPKLRAAQAEVERLKTVESILDRPDVICPHSTTASGLVVATCEVDSKKGVITQNGAVIYRVGWVPVNEAPKTEPKPAAHSFLFPREPGPEGSILVSDGKAGKWQCPPGKAEIKGKCVFSVSSQISWTDIPAVATPFDPEEDLWGKVGPVLIETPGGSLKFKKIEVPRKI